LRIPCGLSQGILKLKRTAYSPNIQERMDASCAIFDAGGRTRRRVGLRMHISDEEKIFL